MKKLTMNQIQILIEVYITSEAKDRAHGDVATLLDKGLIAKGVLGCYVTPKGSLLIAAIRSIAELV